MSRFLLTKKATDDVRNIVIYLRERSPKSATKVKSDLRAAMRKLADMPGMGHHRDDVTDQPLRFWSVYSYLIAYDPAKKPIEIIRVLHGSQDLPKIFDRE